MSSAGSETKRIRVRKLVPRPVERKDLIFYPFRDMEIGDSFVIPDQDSRGAIRVRSAAAKYKPLKFSVRKAETDGKWRCWRVE